MPLDVRIMAQGQDNLAPFKASLTGYCNTCRLPIEVSVKYDKAPLERSLVALGIDPRSKSIILKLKGNAYEIGVTCGCYAKWHRQVAYISKKKESRASRR